MSRPIFEVIATCADDAVAAVEGGADRLELVTDMAADGLTPDVSEFTRIRDAVDVPLRVMIRRSAGFLAGDLDGLRAAARALRQAGASEFVLGFLDAEGRVDLAAMRAVLAEVPGCAWTFHRAVDHAADRVAAREAVAGLAGVDCVLTAGSPKGVGDGLDVLVAEARGGAAPRTMAGGGLRSCDVAPLAAAGVSAFHVGRPVRAGGWASPVDPSLVRAWRELIDAAVGGD